MGGGEGREGWEGGAGGGGGGCEGVRTGGGWAAGEEC